MPYEELIGWFEYFKRRPIGWQDDQRTYMLLQAQGVKERAEKLFPSILAIKQAESEIDEQKRLAQTLKSSGLLAKLQSVANNNKIDWNIND